MKPELKKWLKEKLPEEGYKTVVQNVEGLEDSVLQLTRQIASYDVLAKQDEKRQAYLQGELKKEQERSETLRDQLKQCQKKPNLI